MNPYYFLLALKNKSAVRARRRIPLSANGVTWLSLIDLISQMATTLVGAKTPAGRDPSDKRSALLSRETTSKVVTE
jgi:hypothetical protein